MLNCEESHTNLNLKTNSNQKIEIEIYHNILLGLTIADTRWHAFHTEDYWFKIHWIQRGNFLLECDVGHPLSTIITVFLLILLRCYLNVEDQAEILSYRLPHLISLITRPEESYRMCQLYVIKKT
jgi:hypothetical protein